jgi:hypothetical protein
VIVYAPAATPDRLAVADAEPADTFAVTEGSTCVPPGVVTENVTEPSVTVSGDGACALIVADRLTFALPAVADALAGTVIVVAGLTSCDKAVLVLDRKFPSVEPE